MRTFHTNFIRWLTVIKIAFNRLSLVGAVSTAMAFFFQQKKSVLYLLSPKHSFRPR